jgi:hypothetical protein
VGETTLDLSGIEYVSEADREHFVRMRVGDAVMDFLATPTGRYLTQRAKLDYEDAKEQLIQLDLETPAGIAAARKLQQQALTAHAVMRYVAEAIQDGNVARKQLEEAAEETGD